MIYAIRAVDTGFVKFGKAKNPARRLLILQTGSPHKLALEAVVDWKDAEEGGIHAYLMAKGDHHQGEWFKNSPNVLDIIEAMQKGLPSWRELIRRRAPKRLAHHLKLVTNG